MAAIDQSFLIMFKIIWHFYNIKAECGIFQGNKYQVYVLVKIPNFDGFRSGYRSNILKDVCVHNQKRSLFLLATNDLNVWDSQIMQSSSLIIIFPWGFFQLISNCTWNSWQTATNIVCGMYITPKGTFTWNISDCDRIKFYTHSGWQYNCDIGHCTPRQKNAVDGPCERALTFPVRCAFTCCMLSNSETKSHYNIFNADISKGGRLSQKSKFKFIVISPHSVILKVVLFYR